MPRKRILVLSDIHYASAAEQLRHDHEARAISNPLLRLFVRLFRHYIWLRAPMQQNHLLDQFLSRADAPDYVIANGDYSCDSAFLGVSDDAACQSARECLEKLRRHFAPNLRAVFGDHELGKLSLFGARGGMRLASFQRAQTELGLQPFWRMQLGNYVLFGVVSSLIALPVFERDTLPEERAEWNRLREHTLPKSDSLCRTATPPRGLLFCHDPSAPPVFVGETPVRRRLPKWSKHHRPLHSH